MNLKTATPDQLDALYLPDDALVALAAGQEWEYTPDSVEGADADVYWCDDCGDGTYHRNWCVWGLRLDSDGTLYETLTLVDTDGDWSFADEYPYGTFNHDEERKATRTRWRNYAEYVAKTGLDPVGEFTSFTRERYAAKYIVQFSPSIVGPKVVRVRPVKGKYTPLSDSPSDVRAFFEGMSEFKDMADLRERAHGLTWLDENRASFEVDRYRERSSATARARARLHLTS